jgi:hypothetical protein
MRVDKCTSERKHLSVPEEPQEPAPEPVWEDVEYPIEETLRKQYPEPDQEQR